MFDLDRALRAWRDDVARTRVLTRSDLDELEDHLRAYYEVELDLSPGLAPLEAFEQARRSLGAPEELSAEFAKVERSGWRRLLTAGWTLFAISFFLPVHEYGITLAHPDVGEGLLPGIEAFRVAILGMGGIVGIVGALANLVIPATLWRITDAGRKRVRLLAASALSGALVNLWWLANIDHPTELRAGYYVWLLSFVLIGTGLTLRARDLPEEDPERLLLTE